jgi:hypothetical protein
MIILHNQKIAFKISTCIRKYLEAHETLPSAPSVTSVVNAFPPCEFPKRAVQFFFHSGATPTPCPRAILKRRNPSPQNPRARSLVSCSKT